MMPLLRRELGNEEAQGGGQVALAAAPSPQLSLLLVRKALLNRHVVCARRGRESGEGSAVKYVAFEQRCDGVVEGGRKCVAQNTNFQLHNIIPEPARLFLCAPAAPLPVDVVTNSPHAMNSAC